MAITDRELYGLGMNTDMISGYRAQMAQKHDRPTIWPEHFKGWRFRDWQQGERIALTFKGVQRKIGCMVRSDRNRDFRETGATSRYTARGADRKEQQLKNLRMITGYLRATTPAPASIGEGK